MVHVWSINSGERFQGHHGPLVILSRSSSKIAFCVMGHKYTEIDGRVQHLIGTYNIIALTNHYIHGLFQLLKSSQVKVVQLCIFEACSGKIRVYCFSVILDV